MQPIGTQRRNTCGAPLSTHQHSIIKKEQEHMTSSFESLIGQNLTWVPTATFKSRFDLIAPDNTPRATLDMSSWTSKALAFVPEGTLFLQKENWSGMKIAISLGENGPLLATFQRKWTGTSGQLSFPDGRLFNWNKANFWGTQKVWTDPMNMTRYIQFSSRGFSRQANVVIYPQAAEIPELSLLLVVGLYNILVERRAAATAAAGAAG